MVDNNSGAGNLGKGVLGVGLGFALYMLISGFGGGGGFGLGRGRAAGRGAGGTDRAPVPAPGPTADLAERHKIVLTAAGVTLDGRPMALEEAVERVKGPRDVEVVATGDARHGDVLDLLTALFVAGVNWRGSSELVELAPSSMADVEKIREAKRRTEEWEKLSQAEKEALREAAIREAAREAGRYPTEAEIREAVRRLSPPVEISGNPRGHYGRNWRP